MLGIRKLNTVHVEINSFLIIWVGKRSLLHQNSNNVLEQNENKETVTVRYKQEFWSPSGSGSSTGCVTLEELISALLQSLHNCFPSSRTDLNGHPSDTSVDLVCGAWHSPETERTPGRRELPPAPSLP